MLLREGFELSSTAALRRIASVHGLVHDDATTRAELIERLVERCLDDSAYLEEQLERLSDQERATLLAARAAGGELRGLLVERDYPGASDPLIERGFVFRIFAAAGPLRGEVFQVPEEILALLPKPPAQDAPPAGEPPPAERRASDPSFSLFALVSALIRVGGSLERDVQDWSEEPGGWGWEARWTFLRHLARSAGLLVQQADGTLGPGPTLSRLLDDPLLLTERLWRTYLGDRAWSDLEHAADAFEHGSELAEGVPLRVALVDAVEALPEGAWIGLDAFSSWLRQVRPLAVREQLNARGIVELDSASWADLEHPLLRYIVLGPMYWLGVTAASPDGLHFMRRGVARSAPPVGRTARARRDDLHHRSDAVADDASRLDRDPATAAAEPLQGTLLPELLAPGGAGEAGANQGEPQPVDASVDPGMPQPADGEPGMRGPEAAASARNSPADSRRAAREACSWEGASELVAPTRASLGTLLDAERYLVLRERGRPSRYHLLQSHVAAALGGGGSIADCRRLLRKLTRGPLPQPVEDRLAGWDQRFGALSVRPAVLIEARSPAELDEAIADERVRPFVRGRLGPSVAEVAAADVLELAAALRQSGHLPRVDAALRLASEPRRAYSGLVDEQVLEFLLVALLAFQHVRREYLGQLEGSQSLLERLQRQFPPDRLSQLRAAAVRLSGELAAGSQTRPRARPRRKRRPG